MKVGTKGNLTYKDSSKAEVTLVHITKNSHDEDVNWFSYDSGESNKQIKCVSKHNGEPVFALPTHIAERVFSERQPEVVESPVEEDELAIEKVSKGSVPPEFKDCDTLFTMNIKGQPYKISLGVDRTKNRATVQFGSGVAMVVSKERLAFMFASFSSLFGAAMLEEGHSKPEILQLASMAMEDAEHKAFEIRNGELYKPEEAMLKGDASELRDSINQDSNPIQDASGGMDAEFDRQGSEQLQDIERELAEIQNVRDDFQEQTKSMSEEERNEYDNELSKKENELLSKQASEFEKELLGTIESEEDKEYGFDYFLKIHKEQGSEALKEELTKLPKEDRETMIAKIKEEYKQQKSKA